MKKGSIIKLTASNYETARVLMSNVSEEEVIDYLRKNDSDLSEEEAKEIISFLKEEIQSLAIKKPRVFILEKTPELPPVLILPIKTQKKHGKKHYVPKTIGKVNTSPKFGKYRK